MFKVEFRKDCKVCGNTITHKRSRTYCSAYCRVHYHNSKPENIARHVIWQRTKRDKEAEKPSPNKIKCEICGSIMFKLAPILFKFINIKLLENTEKNMGLILRKDSCHSGIKK